MSRADFREESGKKTLGVLISPQDFMLFERLIAEEEDRLDVKAATKALRSLAASRSRR